MTSVKTYGSLINTPTRTVLRIQALEIVQNLCADAAPVEVGRYLEQLVEGEFMSILVAAARSDQEPEMRIPVSIGSENSPHQQATWISLMIGFVRYCEFGSGQRKDP